MNEGGDDGGQRIVGWLVLGGYEVFCIEDASTEREAMLRSESWDDRVDWVRPITEEMAARIELVCRVCGRRLPVDER